MYGKTKNILNTTLLVLALLFTAGGALAQPFSYVYIQGDKKTPFYVKLDGEMQPRYGKNYAIISRLAAGPAHIQILFQQNAFPPQDFQIEIPVGGFRSFMLSKQGDAFTLYDATQKFYLKAGNDIADDRLPPLKIAPAVAQTPREDPPPVVKSEPRKPAAPEKPATPPPATNTDPRFISGIELPPAGGGKSETAPGGSSTIEPFKPNVAILKNSDCPQAMQSGDFAKMYDVVLREKGDEDRLEAALDEMDNCFESWQARSLSALLEGDAARFSLLKAIYPRISDQHLFPLLDDLLTDPVWKKEFVRLTGK